MAGLSHDFLRLEWQNWHRIPCSGIGNVGFESSFRLLSGIVAQALKGSEGVEARISVKPYR